LIKKDVTWLEKSAVKNTRPKADIARNAPKYKFDFQTLANTPIEKIGVFFFI